MSRKLLSDLMKEKESIANQVIRISKDFIFDEVQFSEGKIIEYIEYTLEYLNTAYILKEDQILIDYLKWLQDLLLRNHVNEDFLENYLEGLNHVIYKILNQKEISQLLNKGISTLREYKGPKKVKIEGLNSSNQRFLDMIINHKSLEVAANLKKWCNQEKITLLQVYDDIITPIQQEVGRLWENRVLTVADEHYITESLIRISDEVYSESPKKKSINHEGIMIFSAEKEKHAFGARLLSNTLLTEGYKVSFYGSNMPVQDMIRAIKKEEPKVIVISVTFSKNMFYVKKAIDQIKSLNISSSIFLGGRSFNIYPHLVDKVGGDYYTKDLETFISYIKDVLSEGEKKNERD